MFGIVALCLAVALELAIVPPAMAAPPGPVCRALANEVNPEDPDPAKQCVEIQRSSFAGAGKTIVVRTVRRASLSDPSLLVFSAKVIADVQQSLTVFLDIFKFEAIDHITVQLDNVPAVSFSAFANVDTPADPVAAVDGTKVDAATDDCFIWLTVHPLKLGEPEPTGDLLASRIAHEVFHCLLSWNFPGTDSPLAAGLWWSEGSAKAMEMLVSQWPATIPKWAKVFDETSAFRPITQMQYEAFVFWAWLFNRDADRVLALFRQLPRAPAKGEGADQLKVFNTLLDIEAFAFASDYISGAAKTVTGTPIPLKLQGGVTTTLAGSGGQVAVSAKAATLYRSTLVLEPGEYRIETTGSGAPLTGLRDPATDFVYQLRFGANVVAPCGSSFKGLLFALPLQDGSYVVNVARTKKLDCSAPSAISSATGHDGCVAGIWALNLAALESFFGAVLRGADIKKVTGDLSYVFDANGAASIVAKDVFVIFDVPLLEHGQLRTVVAVKGIDFGAAWATDGAGQLFYKPGDNKIRVAIVAGTADTGANLLQDQLSSFSAPASFRYDCEGDSLTLTLPDPAKGDIRFILKRRG
jgi:hypothetical protein